MSHLFYISFFCNHQGGGGNVFPSKARLGKLRINNEKEKEKKRRKEGKKATRKYL